MTLESKVKVTRKKGTDHQFKKLLNVTQILLVSNIGNVKRTVWRMGMLMLECDEFRSLIKTRDNNL